MRPAEPLTRYDAALARLARLGRCLATISQSRPTSSSGLLVRSAVPGAVHCAVATALPSPCESFAALETHGPTLGPNPRLVSPHWQLDPSDMRRSRWASSTSPLTPNPGTNEHSDIDTRTEVCPSGIRGRSAHDSRRDGCARGEGGVVVENAVFELGELGAGFDA